MMTTKTERKTQKKNNDEKYMEEIKQLFSKYPDIMIRKRKGARFHFPVYMTKTLEETDVDVLDLSVRSSNALKRVGLYTIGELCEFIAGGESLAKIRSCGEKSRQEIMERLFIYHFQHLPSDKKEQYLIDIVLKNAVSVH